MNKFIVIGLILILAGCEIPEDDKGDSERVFNGNATPVRVEEVSGNDDAIYSIRQFECIDRFAFVSVESKGELLYSGKRQCNDNLSDYKVGSLKIKIHEIADNSEEVKIEVEAEAPSQLCSVGDVVISFRDGIHNTITLIGAVSCNKYIASMPIPNGEYWGRVEFRGYVDQYSEGQFRVSVHTIERL